MGTLNDLEKERKANIEYTCACCGETYEYTQSFEEVEYEAVKNNFQDKDDLVIICDDCYKRIAPEFNLWTTKEE